MKVIPLFRTLQPAAFIPCAFILAGAATLFAAPEEWTGDDATNPTYWGDNDNWVGSAPGFLSYAYFPSSASPGVVEMVNASGNSLFRTGIEGANLEGAGWIIQDTVGAGTGGWRYDFNGTAASIGSQPYGINSTGAGVNEFKAIFTFASGNTPDTGQPSRPITVGTGNTLLFSGEFNDPQAWTLQGSGTMVVNNTNTGARNNFNSSIVINGTPTLINRGGMSIAGNAEELDSGTIGGDGTFWVRSGSVINFTGTTLMAGGDGTAAGGAEIGTLLFQTGIDSSSNIDLESGTMVELQLGTGGVGDNDQLHFSLFGGNVDIGTGVTLSLSGTTIQDGTYTLFSDVGSSGDFTGTFDTVLFNGLAADPSNFTVNYGADTITLDVSGVPEPTSLALLTIGGLLLISRRRTAKP